MPSKWEYFVLGYGKSLFGDSWSWSDESFKGKYLGQILNELGAEGWELVGTTVEAHSRDGERAGATTDAEYILKRPIF